MSSQAVVEQEQLYLVAVTSESGDEDFQPRVFDKIEKDAVVTSLARLNSGSTVAFYRFDAGELSNLFRNFVRKVA